MNKSVKGRRTFRRYAKAYAALKPGGRMIVHDFMVGEADSIQDVEDWMPRRG